MAFKSFKNAGALTTSLALAAALTACGNKEEGIPLISTATPQQLQIVKEETRKKLEQRNQHILEALEKRKSESVDGAGRIFHDADQKTLTIYRNAPVANLHRVSDLDDRDARDKFLKILWEHSHRISNISEDELRARASRDDSFDPFYGGESVIKGPSSIVKLNSGRVCEDNPSNSKKDDCFAVTSLDPQVQLAKDITLAKRKLGLQIQAPS